MSKSNLESKLKEAQTVDFIELSSSPLQGQLFIPKLDEDRRVSNEMRAASSENTIEVPQWFIHMAGLILLSGIGYLAYQIVTEVIPALVASLVEAAGIVGKFVGGVAVFALCFLFVFILLSALFGGKDASPKSGKSQSVTNVTHITVNNITNQI